ncbi:PTS sugar transporter subunit IIB [Fredinandcohnia sp. FSL W7-1320]|uniref:PTS sugar transporter subunit IIB n=1 Tax=Fredinandcohnia sp. FSL W7-1320 TaxID=2954540 RepID=UPI0030FD9C08
MKTIIVACGAGVATSTLICDRVQKLLSSQNIQANIIQCTLGDISRYVDQANVIVTSMKVDRSYSIPIVLGISFITGVGVEQTEKEILESLS